MIKKTELVLWGLSALVAFLFIMLVVLSNVFRKTGGANHGEGANEPLSQQISPQAQIAAEQDWMSGSILRVEPSVVCICTTGRDMAGKGTQVCEAGTGVIIASNGVVLTTSAVASGGADIKVIIYEHSGLDGPSFEIGHNHIYDADVISTFPAAGFAVVKIDAANLPVAGFGDSQAISPGDWCLAIGSGYGKKPEVTSGIILGLGRVSRTDGHVHRNLIEMNCSSKSYFVGGPLISDEGEVLGIIIEKGYAIPASRIVPVLAGLNVGAF
jgi:S1-C subfamily serine protease